MWGEEWDLPTLIANLEGAQVPGVELRIEHAHKVAALVEQKEIFQRLVAKARSGV